ncbi:MAG: hypothetical protein IT562_10840 [Alphaproteobacteria bacterium]|nr:hypothetical protein [Alphaproteobacteria bacterium]
MPVFTLPEYAKTKEKTDFSRPVIEMFGKSADIYEALPFETLGAAVFEGYRQAALPTVAFRGINEESSNGNGRVAPFQEATFVVDHDIDVDDAIIRRNGMQRRSSEEQMAVAALGKLWLDTFVFGDNTSDPREFNGLQKRAESFSRKIAAGSTSGGDALSLAKLDEAINNVNGPNAILVGKGLMPRFIAAARNTSISGFVIQSWDQVGQPKMTYNGIRLYFGYEKDDHGFILPFTEANPGGGSAVGTSIYVMSLGEGKLRGIMLKDLMAEDVGRVLTGTKPIYRTHVSWDVGLVDEHKYCFTRLWGIKDAAFVA